MDTVNVHDAKTQFSRLLARVELGEEFVIARGGRPVARLVPLVPKALLGFGAWKEPVQYGDSPATSQPEEVLESHAAGASSATTAPARYAVEMGHLGRLDLPGDLRSLLQIEEGDRLVLSPEPDGSLRLISARVATARLRGLFASRSPERVLSEELVAERRAEAERERLE